MRKNLCRLYYLLRYGGWCYVWVGILSRVLGHEKSRKILYRKAKTFDASEYENEIVKMYALIYGKKLDLKNPLTFSEKIQWLKVNDSTPLKAILADKYLVREWVQEKIGEQYLIPILGVWDAFEEIKIDELPQSFVLKANHGSGWNVVVKDKRQINRKEVQRKFDEWLSLNFALLEGYELQYLNIPPKIIAEEYIEDFNDNLYDYKIYCFNGNPEYIQVVGDRDLATHKGKQAFYNTQWIKQP
ncbi:MAG: hypothetical protein HDR29_03485, partial [Lachnospiraceae bacterium]|nr:hypothetical protein [Lachnospiraceae bacterium]